MRRVFVCSPLRAGRGRTVEDNFALARRLCRAAVASGCAPIAPHLLFTQFLDDDVHDERVVGMAAGVAWIDACEAVWVYAENLEDCSEGMRAEVTVALGIGKPVLYRPTAWRNL
jgi:hypothetical protein